MDNIDAYDKAKQQIQRAFEYTQEPRDRAADDWMFAHFNHWDEQLEEYSDNEYRGQFDIITRQLRTVKGEMLANPIGVKYRAVDGDNPSKEAAETLQKIYRASMRTNAAKEAVDVAVDSQVSTGFGAWRLTTEYENKGDNTDTSQTIRRVPIHEANNVVYFDPSARRKDKSDSLYGGVLTAYTRESYEMLCEEYDCEGRSGSNAHSPANSGVFPFSGGELIYVAEHYEVKRKKKKILIMSNGIDTITVMRNRGKEAKFLEEQGYEITDRKVIEKREVYKSIIDGEGLIDGPVLIAGKHIPIVPLFGEWRYIEGQEYWEGMVRRAKDPQRLHNMAFSFIADQVGRSPRRKPFFAPDQIAGWEHMYTQDADFPYYMLNLKDADGNPLPLQPLSYMEGPTVNATETAFLQMTEKAVQDVTVTPSVGQNAVSDGVTEGQLRLANAQNQMQTFIYQDNLATAMRRDGEIYQSIAADIYTDEVEMVGMNEDDTTENIVINRPAYDDRGEPYIENQISEIEFEVYTDIGPRYQDARQEAAAKLESIADAMGPQTPMGQAAYMMLLSMIDLPGAKDFEDYFDRQALISGLKTPSTDEEKLVIQQLQQQQANQPPSAEQMIGQAEMYKAQADMITAQTRAQTSQFDSVKSIAETQKKEAETAEILAKLQRVDIERVKDLLDIVERTSDMETKELQKMGFGAQRLN